MLMFTEKEFAAFEVAGLDERMAVIRAQIQPIFQELDTYFAEQLAPELGTELFVHIAQHRRRTVYPPENTWSALSPNKRGYKMQPHFQLGIWGDYVFMWLSFIDNPKNEKQIAQAFRESAIIPSITRRYVCFLGSYGSSNYSAARNGFRKSLNSF